MKFEEILGLFDKEVERLREEYKSIQPMDIGEVESCRREKRKIIKRAEELKKERQRIEDGGPVACLIENFKKRAGDAYFQMSLGIFK